MKITQEEIAHVASLARIAVSPEQIAAYQKDLNALLERFQVLNELDTTDTPPTSHALDFVNVSQRDEQIAPLTQEEALANAPQKAYGHFRVPRVIE